MKKNIVYLVLVCIAFLGCKNETAFIKKVSVKEAKTILANTDVQIVDVRTPQELQEDGFIKGAENINFNSEDFENKVNRLNKAQPVFVYCKGGVRSAAAAKKMKILGFVKIYDLENGFSNWKNENYTTK